MKKTFKHLFGPVPSRRFGLSLGVDLVPHKTCSLDCVFCEVGPTTYQTRARKEYVPTSAVLKELASWFALKQHADFITVTGAGEPTLHTRFGEVLAAIRAHGKSRAALLTNSTLLYLPEVREAAAKADVVKATLLAWDQASFRAITQAPPEVKFEQLLDGLQRFRPIFQGELWLEVFMVPGLNTAKRQVKAIAALARTIRPDRIQLNTAVRPTAQPGVPALSEAQLKALAGYFSPRAEVIARFVRQRRIRLRWMPGAVPMRDSRICLARSRRKVGRGLRPSRGKTAHPAPFAQKLRRAREGSPYHVRPAKALNTYGARSGLRKADKAAVLAMLQRRPCTAADVAQAFSLSRKKAKALVQALIAEGRIQAEERQGETYYRGA